MVFNATFNNVLAISWRSVLFVEETEVPEDDQRPVVSHWQTLSHNVVFGLAKLVLIGTDCIGSNKNYHTITTTTPVDPPPNNNNNNTLSEQLKHQIVYFESPIK